MDVVIDVVKEYKNILGCCDRRCGKHKYLILSNLASTDNPYFKNPTSLHEC